MNQTLWEAQSGSHDAGSRKSLSQSASVFTCRRWSSLAIGWKSCLHSRHRGRHMSITHRSLLFHRVHVETQRQEAQHCPQEVLLADAGIRPPDLFVIIWSVLVHVWNKFRSGAGDQPITIRPSARLWGGGEAGQEKCRPIGQYRGTCRHTRWENTKDSTMLDWWAGPGASRTERCRSSPFIVLMMKRDAASNRLAIASNSDGGFVRT